MLNTSIKKASFIQKTVRHKEDLYLILFGSALFILGYSIIKVHLWQRSFVPLPDTNISLSQKGEVFQGSQRIAGGSRQSTDIEINIPLSNEESGQNTDSTFRLSLPHPFNETNLKVEAISVQGVSQAKVYLENSTSVFFSMPHILPDSHTRLVLHIAPKELDLPPLISIFSWLPTLPLYLWSATALGLFIAFALYARFKTRHLRMQSNKIQEYPPDNLTSLQLAILIRGRLRVSDISALIYDLANRGMVNIVKKENSTLFLRTSKPSTDLHFHEEMLLKLISQHGTKPTFGDEVISQISQTLFSSTVTNIYVEAYNSLSATGYFKRSIRHVHLEIKTLSILIQLFGLSMVLSSYLFLGSLRTGPILLGIVLYLIGNGYYWLAYRAIPFTPLGLQRMLEAKSFLNYLSSPSQLNLTDKEGYTLFYNYLPYAIANNLSSYWLNRFNKYPLTVPKWFTTSEQDVYRPEQFMVKVEQVTQELATIFVTLKDPNVD